MSSIRILITLLFGFLCSCNPNVSTTSIQIPNNWAVKNSKFKLTNHNLKCLAWWKQFHDPVLNRLINIGLQENNDIQIAKANIEAAEGELKKIQLNWIPSVNGNLGYSSFPYLGYPGVLAAIVPTYTLNIFSQINEQKRAKYQLAVTENVRDSIKLAIISEIAVNYFSFLAHKERLDILKGIEQDRINEISIYQSAYQGGLVTDIDVTKIKSKVELIRAEEMMIQKNMVIHQNAIQYLLNRNPEPLRISSRFQDLNSSQLIIGSLPLNVIENRPDMLQATYELKAANADVLITGSNFLPSIQLSMARGDIATVPNGTTLGQPIYFNQALLQAPLLTLSSLGDWDKAKALRKASWYHYQDTLRRVLREVNDDLATHEYFNRRLQQSIQAEKYYDQAWQLTERLQKQGIVSYAKLLKEKINRDQIKIKVNRDKLDQLISIVHLYQDLAVGYGCSICTQRSGK